MKARMVRFIAILSFLLGTAGISFGGTQYCKSTFGGSNNTPSNVVVGKAACIASPTAPAGAPKDFTAQNYTQFSFLFDTPCSFQWIDGTSEPGFQAIETSGFGLNISPNGDLLIQQDTPGNLGCLNPATGHVVLTIDGIIIGGTGANTGATGSYSSNVAAALLVPGKFGWLIGSSTSIRTLP